jgi:hypothetical protein
MHPYPKLLHPINVTMRLLNRGATKWDHKAREPIGKPARDVTVQLQAQIRWNDMAKPDPQFQGVRETSKCYLLFRHCDLTDAAVTIKRGDMVTKVGQRDVKLFATWFEDAGHLPDYGGATLFLVWCLDRNPGEQEGDL